MGATKHGKERSRKRLGIKAKAVNRNVARVALLGKTKEHFDGGLYRYLVKIESETGNRNTNERILIYGTHIYVMAGNDLITMWAIPTRFLRRKPGREYDFPIEEVTDNEDA